MEDIFKTLGDAINPNQDEKTNGYYYIEIRKYDNEEVVKRIDATHQSLRTWEKIEQGMSINLNHAEYYIHRQPSVNPLPTI